MWVAAFLFFWHKKIPTHFQAEILTATSYGSSTHVKLNREASSPDDHGLSGRLVYAGISLGAYGECSASLMDGGVSGLRPTAVALQWCG